MWRSSCVLAEPAALDAALAVLLLRPSPPLMFMGDEWGATQPFPFFCDFTGDLADAVRSGRRSEFAEAYAEHGDEIPDPLAEETRVRGARLERARRADRTPSGLPHALAAGRDASDGSCRCLPAMTGEGSADFSGDLDGALASRWQKPAAAGKSLGRAQCNALSRWLGATPIWGDDPAASAAAVVGVCGDRRRVMPHAVPLATYRLQLTKDFGFDDAAALVPYLKSLGIRHLYASPFLKARPGSTHGYDIVDHDRSIPNSAARKPSRD